MPISAEKSYEAALALHRFGFGPRGDAIAAIASDPRGAILAELGRVARPDDADRLSSGAAARAAFDFHEQRKAARLAQRAEQAMNPAAQADRAQQDGNAAPAQVKNPAPGVPQQIYLEEAKARFDLSLSSEFGFVERLVWFWSNHFCVSADKGQVRPLAGAYEREVVRQHVLGRFSDMLLAAESHPAMLVYLDNARSIGPNSPAGLRRGKGLNENLAREILELHTLGVRTVYSQDDVVNFAKVITGWTVIPPRQSPERGGEFVFNPRMHEPGAQTIVGKSYADHGVEQGRAVLRDLARHPATAQHVATKLARHFVADNPPPALVELLRTTFLRTDGDLKELARVLISAPKAWNSPRTKLKRPGEWLVCCYRAVGLAPPDVCPLVQAQNMLGEPLWRPPAPKGFDDGSAVWLDGLAQRFDIANQLSRRAVGDPTQLVDTALGPLASSETRQAIARAESRPQALALLLMAPEFLRR